MDFRSAQTKRFGVNKEDVLDFADFPGRSQKLPVRHSSGETNGELPTRAFELGLERPGPPLGGLHAGRELRSLGTRSKM